MKFNKRKFLAVLTLTGISVRDVATAIGMSYVTLYKKINGQSDFFRNEIVAICALLNLNDAQMNDIFFSAEVSLT